MSINQIEATLKKVLKDALVISKLCEDYDTESIVIEIPKDSSNGDYSSNIAMQLTKVLKRNPREIATAIVENLNKEEGKIEKVEIAGPGFLNFFVNKSSIASIITEVLAQQDKYGHSNHGKGIKYDIEYVSANPTGDLHLGHARGAAGGDSLARIMMAAGYDVTREYYVNDAGNQIKNLAYSLMARYNQECGLDWEMPEDGYHGSDIKNIAVQIREIIGDKYKGQNNEEAYKYFRETGKEYELEKIKVLLKDFGVEFDVWFSETSLYEDNMIIPTLDKLKSLGHTYEADGALWLRSTDYNDDKDRVLIKTDGTYTYLVPDIAYHLNKLDRGYDYLVDILGADHHGYINRLKASIQALGYEANKLEVDICQMVRLVRNGEEVKMSKRTGNAITIRSLIDETGVDAVRYFFVSKAANTHFDFDLDLAESKSNENPVYYVQYAHARMASILGLAKEANIELASNYELLTHEKEIELLKYINEFKNVVVDAADARLPHKIVNYVQKVAQLFHSFYNECKVVDSTNIELSSQRLALVAATKITLKNALNLIGVSAPEKM